MYALLRKFIFVIIVLLFSLSISSIHKQDAYATALNNVKISYSVIHDLTKNTYTYKVLVGNQGPSSSQGIQRFILEGNFGDILYLGGPEPSGWSGYDPTQPDFSTSTSSSYIYPVNWDTFYFQGTQLDTLPAQAHVELYGTTNGTQWLTTQTSCGSGDVAASCQVTCVTEGSEGIQSIVTCPQSSSQGPILNEGANPNPSITTLNSNSSVTVQTDKPSYVVGDKMTISGSASPVSANPVVIQIFDPSNNLIRTLDLSIASTGIYSWPLSVTTALFSSPGLYTIKASYEGANAQTTFTFVNNSPTNTSCPPDYILVNGQCVVGAAPSQNQPTQPSQGNYTVTVSTDKSSYILGDMVKLSGTASPASSNPVTLQFFDPSDKIIVISQAVVQPSGTYFTQTGVTTQPFEMNGIYTLKATYQGASAQTTFSVTNAQSPMPSTPQSCPGTVFPNGQCVIYAGGRCIDQYGNAITGGVTIQNNQCVSTTQASNESSLGNQTTHAIVIPSWIKNNAKWWAAGQLSDDEFVKAMQYLINNGMMQIQQNLRLVDNNGKNLGLVDNNGKKLGLTEKAQLGGGANTTSGSEVTLQGQIPSWVKNTAKWWSEGQVSDDEFVKGMQYLINNGMMHVELGKIQPRFPHPSVEKGAVAH